MVWPIGDTLSAFLLGLLLWLLRRVRRGAPSVLVGWDCQSDRRSWYRRFARAGDLNDGAERQRSRRRAPHSREFSFVDLAHTTSGPNEPGLVDVHFADHAFGAESVRKTMARQMARGDQDWRAAPDHGRGPLLRRPLIFSALQVAEPMARS